MKQTDALTAKRVSLPEPQVVQDLRAAKALIEDPDRWCQGAFAKMSNGMEVMPINSAAHSYCALGSAIKVSNQEFTLAAALNRTAKKMGHDYASVLNDSTDHPTVMKMFDLAIELALEEAQ